MNYNQQNAGFTEYNFSRRYAQKPKNDGDVKHFRFVGNPFKYKVHNEFSKSITKICTKSLSVRYEPTINDEGFTVMGDYVYAELDAQGNKIPYNVDEYLCSCCMDEMTPRNNWAINVIDMDEEREAIARGEVPNLKILEMTKTVHEQLKEYHSNTGIHPQDIVRGPVFEMRAYYKTEPGQKPKTQDKRYRMTPVNNGSAYTLPEHWCEAFFVGVNGKAPLLHDLADVYHPLKQGEKLNAWVRPAASGATATASAPVYANPQQQPAYQQPAQQQTPSFGPPPQAAGIVNPPSSSSDAPQANPTQSWSPAPVAPANDTPQFTVPSVQPSPAPAVSAQAQFAAPPSAATVAPAPLPASAPAPEVPVQSQAPAPSAGQYQVSQSAIDEQIKKLNL